ncbi:MAG: hypothetical protein Q4B18_08850, partial [Bacillota bacterium]|nr:hypothetical protein [Bacillota bacterium]
KLALLGFGNAGQAFAEMLLAKRGAIQEKYGYDILVTAIATNTKGNLIDADGIDLRQALADVSACGKFAEPSGSTTMEIVKNADYDVLIEMTPLNIFTGQPAIDHIEAAFSRGKDVITANKGPIAWKFKALDRMAKQHNCKFFYETTVMDGTPVFNLTEKNLQLAEVTEVSGILNSTTNFILEELA